MPRTGAAPACLCLGGLSLEAPAAAFFRALRALWSAVWIHAESNATNAGFGELSPAPLAPVTWSRFHPAVGGATGNDRVAGYSVFEVPAELTPASCKNCMAWTIQAAGHFG